MEVTYEKYKLIALAELVKMPKGVNPAAIGLTDAEARKKGYWLNEDKLPSESEIRAKFQEIKPKLQKKKDRADSKINEALESEKSSKEFEDLYYDLELQDDDLGLNEKQLARLGVLIALGRKHKALRVLKKSTLLTKEG